MWYFDTPIGRAVIDRKPGQDTYYFAFNGEEGDRSNNPKVLVDNAYCHCVGVWEWDKQNTYDVPDDLRNWSRG